MKWSILPARNREFPASAFFRRLGRRGGPSYRLGSLPSALDGLEDERTELLVHLHALADLAEHLDDLVHVLAVRDAGLLEGTETFDRPIDKAVAEIRERYGTRAIRHGETGAPTGPYTGLKMAFDRVPSPEVVELSCGGRTG